MQLLLGVGLIDIITATYSFITTYLEQEGKYRQLYGPQNSVCWVRIELLTDKLLEKG